jgi:hypothetical protein
MADEITIHEHAEPNRVTLVKSPLITSQVLDLTVKSAAFNALTRVVRITAQAAAWVKIGDTNVSANANTDGNIYLHAADTIEIEVEPGQFLDSAADA